MGPLRVLTGQIMLIGLQDPDLQFWDQETEMWMAEWSETRAQGSSDGRTRKQTRKRKCAAPKLFFTENDLLCCRYWDQRQESQTNKRKCRVRSSREDRPCRSEDKKTQREQTNKRTKQKTEEDNSPYSSGFQTPSTPPARLPSPPSAAARSQMFARIRLPAFTLHCRVEGWRVRT